MNRFVRNNADMLKPLAILVGIWLTVYNFMQMPYKWAVAVTFGTFSLASYLSARNEHKRWERDRDQPIRKF